MSDDARSRATDDERIERWFVFDYAAFATDELSSHHDSARGRSRHRERPIEKEPLRELHVVAVEQL